MRKCPDNLLCPGCNCGCKKTKLEGYPSHKCNNCGECQNEDDHTRK